MLAGETVDGVMIGIGGATTVEEGLKVTGGVIEGKVEVGEAAGEGLELQPHKIKIKVTRAIPEIIFLYTETSG